MFFGTHLVTGAAVGLSIYALSPELSAQSLPLVVGLNVALSGAPDIDLLWKKNLRNHHDSLTHYPIFWIALTIILAILEKLVGHSGFVLTRSLLISTLIHLILDTFGFATGIKWLWPLSNREFSFTTLQKDIQYKGLVNYLSFYIKNTNFFWETFLGTLSVLIIFFFHYTFL